MAPGRRLVAWASIGILVRADPATRTWPNAQDAACTPMSTCTGSSADPMPENRGKCVGPSQGCSNAGDCMCKDMCNMDNQLEDYTYSDQDAAEKAAQRGQVQKLREGGLPGVQCPASTLQQSDAQVCGRAGEVGEDCALPDTQSGVGQCAAHPETEKVQCLNVCDSSYTERDFGRMGSEADREKYLQTYSNFCAWSTLSIVAIVLLILAAIVGVFLLVAFICFRNKRRKPAVAHRSLDYTQEVHTAQPTPEVPVTAVEPPRVQAAPRPVEYTSLPAQQVVQQASTVQYFSQPNLFQGRQLSQVSSGYAGPTYTSNYSHAGAYQYHTLPGTTPIFAASR